MIIWYAKYALDIQSLPAQYTPQFRLRVSKRLTSHPKLCGLELVRKPISILVFSFQTLFICLFVVYSSMIVIYMTHKPGDGLDHRAHEQKWSLTSGPLIMLMIKMIINIIVKIIFDHAHDYEDDNYKSFYSRWWC